MKLRMAEQGLLKPDMRADKWLWAVRLFKTRSLSAEACRKGRVLIGDIIVKPSRVLRVGDIISLRRPPSVYTYKVIGLVDKRQPAKLVGEYLEDLTPAEEKEKSQHKNLLVFAKRDRGTGRPTKRERRNIDRLNDSD
jgi:ribosome-associated heat shock protein Hsp15